MSHVVDDVRSALRQLARRPGFTLAAGGVLALGIGATTTVFGIAHAVLLRPLPFPDPDRLVQVYEVPRDPATGRVDARGWFAWQNYADVRDEVHAFEALAAWQYYDRTLTGRGAAQRLAGRMITPDFFRVLGIRPALGRSFTPEDVIPGRERVAILGNGVWQGRFGADPGVIGRTIRLDGIPHEVVGVMPRGFDFPVDAELWMPLVPFLGEGDAGARRFHRYRVVGRLADHAEVRTATSQLAALADRLRRDHPETNADVGLRALPLRDVLVGEARPAIRLLGGATALLLLLACVNVAGLVLVHASARDREIAVRAALGATRGRIMRQLLAEAIVLAAAGAGAGLLLASWSIESFRGLVGDALPRIEDVSVDARVLGFGLLLGLATTLVFGLAPALRAARDGGTALARAGSRGATADPAVRRARRALVATEIALAIVLLVGAGLLLRSLDRLRGSPTNVDADHLLTLDLSLPDAGYDEAARRTAFYETLLSRVRQLPGVVDAAAALAPPLHGYGWGNRLYIERRAVNEADLPSVGYDVVTPAFFRTSRIPLLAGRELDGHAADIPEVVVNRTLAERYWPDGSAVGRRVRFAPDGVWATIVGVAEDVPPVLGEAPAAAVYVSPAVESVNAMSLLVRTRDDGDAVVPAIRALLAQLDANVPITRVSSMRQHLSEATGRTRYLSVILATVAAIALLLASVGLYAVLAYSVRQRRRELAIRQAVGAGPRDLVVLVAREAAILALGGMLAGLAAAVLLAQLASSLLYGIRPTDPVTYVAAAAAALLVAAAATWLPARSAARIEPIAALNDGA